MNTARTRATMKDVAARAGVGLATVSRVVNGDANVSEQTRSAVQNAIETLDFRRNDSARLLRQGIAASIGVVLDDMSDPFFSTLNRAIETEATLRGTLSITASSSNDTAHARELIQALCARRVDGLIVAAPGGLEQSFLQEEIRAGTPMVFVDRPPEGFEADTVLSDNFGGAVDGVNHLITQGHRRIACLSDGSKLYTVQQRIDGYWQALRGAGISAVPQWEHADQSSGTSLADWLTKMSRWSVQERPTAIFCTNSRASVAVLRALRASDTDWPALLCFDDFELADVIRPGISVVAQDPAAIGKRAAELLFSRLDGSAVGSQGPARAITVKTRLIPRGSAESPTI
ncbi:LacI family DNA-binding transcriptional regulator [Psychromicrobium lacuslunae]|uniref:HTH lacI-type domain-containing protein n=1 Tax=Psychromicrobium lacuslunae TaxID=1618207 RepID=A0A0D4C442_9MICC|nr:LacI family DNA-binding transcriptional regulator [Psychromicrobium lacuslunae]AJT43145.1 hypothetical protein UM93_13620 [Psychromicrobium lacuslunae]